jgi:hypothetical protein
VWKFLHCADLHLDSPLRGLSDQYGVPVEELRAATRKALRRLVALAEAESVAFVVIAGDVFDGEWQDFRTGLAFHQAMAELNEAGIDVFLAYGNHDAESVISRRLRLPPNVYTFAVDHPETVRLEEWGAAIHGQGFARRDVTDNLALGFPLAVPGLVNIGVLHTAVEGQEGHDRYAPCRLGDLLGKGYDYWALGHIRHRQILHRDPYVVYSGNLQGRHIRETGEKGAVLVTVDGSRIAEVQFVDLDVVRWALCRVDATGLRRVEELFDQLASVGSEIAAAWPDLPLVVRVVVVGQTPLHGLLWAESDRWTDEAVASVSTAAPGRLWVESVKWETRPPEGRPTEQAGDALAQLAATAARLRADADFLKEVRDYFAAVERHMPGYFRRDGALRVESDEAVRRLMEDAEALLRAEWMPEGHEA